MAYEHKEGKGTIFPNDFKTSENQPDYRGKAKWNGQNIEISLWKGETQAGGEKFSVSISEPRQKTEVGSFNNPDTTPKPPQRKFTPDDDRDNDPIPF